MKYDITPMSLVDKLRSICLSYRTGILLLKPVSLSRQDDVAITLGIDHVDLHYFLKKCLDRQRTFLHFDMNTIVSSIRDSVNSSSVISNCVLLSNIDVMISSLSSTERDAVWNYIRTSYRPDKGILISMPDTCNNLLSRNEIEAWASVARITSYDEEI